MKEYEYYDMFNVSDVGNAIATIINTKEETNYICTKVDCIIPEHQRKVWTSPTDSYIPYGDGLNFSNGAQLRETSTFGHFVNATIPQETYRYIILMPIDKYNIFKTLSFTSKEEILAFLRNLCPVYKKYDGALYTKDFISKYPYLQSFFDALNVWRAATGRVTLDEEVLNSCLNEALNSPLIRTRTKKEEV